jgi:hypothetical protein
MDYRDTVCISMAATERGGFYRFSSRGEVFYVQVHETSILKKDEHGFPPAILRHLSPRPPSCNWADITDREYGEWRVKELKGVQQCWHTDRIDLRDLEPIKYFNECVCHCIYQSQPVVAKIARFEFEIPYIERESAVYHIINSQNIGPRFLGYLTENGRVMGILLDYIPARRVFTSANSEICLHALRKLHQLNILLNDNNKFNFLVSADGSTAFICDFSNSQMDADKERLLREESEIAQVLDDDSGEPDDDWSDFGQERLKSMSTSDYRI